MTCILIWNDGQIRRHLLTRKRQLIRDGRSVLTLILVILYRQHPLTEATFGQANISLMNEIGYDGVTIGNNEVRAKHASTQSFI